MTMIVTSVASRNGIMLARISNASGSVGLDCTHDIFDITQTGDIAFSFYNVPTAAVITVIIKRTGAFAESWPASVRYTDDVAPAPSTVTGLEDTYTLITANSGVSWRLVPAIQGAPA